MRGETISAPRDTWSVSSRIELAMNKKERTRRERKPLHQPKEMSCRGFFRNRRRICKLRSAPYLIGQAPQSGPTLKPTELGRTVSVQLFFALPIPLRFMSDQLGYLGILRHYARAPACRFYSIRHSFIRNGCFSLPSLPLCRSQDQIAKTLGTLVIQIQRIHFFDSSQSHLIPGDGLMFSLRPPCRIPASLLRLASGNERHW